MAAGTADTPPDPPAQPAAITPRIVTASLRIAPRASATRYSAFLTRKSCRWMIGLLQSLTCADADTANAVIQFLRAVKLPSAVFWIHSGALPVQNFTRLGPRNTPEALACGASRTRYRR